MFCVTGRESEIVACVMFLFPNGVKFTFVDVMCDSIKVMFAYVT